MNRAKVPRPREPAACHFLMKRRSHRRSTESSFPSVPPPAAQDHQAVPHLMLANTAIATTIRRGNFTTNLPPLHPPPKASLGSQSPPDPTRNSIFSIHHPAEFSPAALPRRKCSSPLPLPPRPPTFDALTQIKTFRPQFPTYSPQLKLSPANPEVLLLHANVDRTSEVTSI